MVTQGKIKEEEEEADEKDKEKDKKDHPKENIENILKSIGLAECIAKMKEAEVAEPDIFFDLDEGT